MSFVSSVYFKYDEPDPLQKILTELIEPKKKCIIETVPIVLAPVDPLAKYYPNNISIQMSEPYYNIKKTYPALDDDITVQKTVSKYFKNKIFDKYLRDEFYDILGYFVVDGSEVKLIGNISEYTNKMEPTHNDELKLNELSENYISTKLIYKLLKSFVRKNGVKWYHLQNHDIEKKVKKYLHKKIKQLIEEKIKKNQ